MLWNAATVRGFEVLGTDGAAAGVVADMLFDEVWTVRALLLDGGEMLPVARVNKLDGQRRLVAMKAEAAAADAPAAGAGLEKLGELLGMTLIATDGGVGPVRDVLFQDSDWKVRFFTAEAGNGKGKVLLAATSVTAVDRAEGVVKLDMDRKAVNASPPFEGDLGVDGAGADDHEARRSYFGVEIVAPEKGPGLPD